MRKILNVATFGLSGLIIGNKKKKEAAPAAPAPQERVMPLPDDEAIRRARRNSVVRQRGRSGRGSTILTSSGSTLGGS